MDIRKRKDTPESAIDDGDAPNRRTKLRTEEDLGDVPAGTEDPSAENATMVSTAAAASAVDASALPSSTDPETLPVSNDPAIEVEKALIAPANAASPESITAIENPDLVAAATEEIAPKIDPKPYTAEELANWNQMFFQLMLYRIENGNVNVKSTDRKHGDLYSWIVQLRKDYKTRERDPSESPLTEAQISVLESVRFAFTTRGEEHWQKSYERLKEYKANHGHVLVPRQCEIQGLGDWVTSQRQQYQEYRKGRPTPLTKQRKELLDEIGFQFRIRNRPEWGSKYQELLDYKEKHGDTRVPQHFKENKALGKWVAKQREQYKLHKKGKHSFLTPDRLEKLNSIGFVWSVRGESSTSQADKNVTNPLPDEKIEPTAVVAVDVHMPKTEGEDKVIKEDMVVNTDSQVPVDDEVNDIRSVNV